MKKAALIIAGKTSGMRNIKSPGGTGANGTKVVASTTGSAWAS